MSQVDNLAPCGPSNLTGTVTGACFPNYDGWSEDGSGGTNPPPPPPPPPDTPAIVLQLTEEAPVDSIILLSEIDPIDRVLDQLNQITHVWITIGHLIDVTGAATQWQWLSSMFGRIPSWLDFAIEIKRLVGTVWTLMSDLTGDQRHDIGGVDDLTELIKVKIPWPGYVMGGVNAIPLTDRFHVTLFGEAIASDALTARRGRKAASVSDLADLDITIVNDEIGGGGNTPPVIVDDTSTGWGHFYNSEGKLVRRLATTSWDYNLTPDGYPSPVGFKISDFPIAIPITTKFEEYNAGFAVKYDDTPLISPPDTEAGLDSIVDWSDPTPRVFNFGYDHPEPYKSNPELLNSPGQGALFQTLIRFRSAMPSPMADVDFDYCMQLIWYPIHPVILTDMRVGMYISRWQNIITVNFFDDTRRQFVSWISFTTDGTYINQVLNDSTTFPTVVNENLLKYPNMSEYLSLNQSEVFASYLGNAQAQTAQCTAYWSIRSTVLIDGVPCTRVPYQLLVYAGSEEGSTWNLSFAVYYESLGSTGVTIKAIQFEDLNG
jgi:hypothetical protein